MSTTISVFAIIFLLGGIYGIWSQRAPFGAWQSVPASVVDQSVERESNLLDDPALEAAVGAGTAQAIKGLAQTLTGDDVTDADMLRKNVRRISYRYYFDGKPHTSSMVYLGSEGSSDDLFDRFPVGRTVTAWVDPSSPGRSYLIPTPRFLGYGLVLTALLMLSLLVGIDVVKADGGFRLEFPGNWLPYMILWWLAGIAAVIHYASLRGPFSVGGAVFALVYFVLASLPVLIPWAKTHLVPWLNAHGGPWLAGLLPEGTAMTVFAAITGGFLVLLLVVLPLWFAAMQSYEASRFHNEFQPVQARVIVSEIRKETRGGGGQTHPTYQFYWPEIQFEYTVNGTRYDTGVYAPSNSYAGAIGKPNEAMRAILADYPLNSTHEARYDPAHPHIAYLTAETGGFGEFAITTLKYLLYIVVIPLVLLYGVIILRAKLGS